MSQIPNNNATLEWPAKYNEVPKEVFERADLWPKELENIFYGAEWHPIVHQSEIPNIGDYKAADFVGYSALKVSQSVAQIAVNLHPILTRKTLVYPPSEQKNSVAYILLL